MLHIALLSRHGEWARFFANLKFVVLDEAHVYRGVFGSNVALVLRRLRRICRYYGAKPVFILCSATIANPGEHASALTDYLLRWWTMMALLPEKEISCSGIPPWKIRPKEAERAQTVKHQCCLQSW
jgi:ATP-dependent helicase YprA (DUF1998 family)